MRYWSNIYITYKWMWSKKNNRNTLSVHTSGQIGGHVDVCMRQVHIHTNVSMILSRFQQLQYQYWKISSIKIASFFELDCHS